MKSFIILLAIAVTFLASVYAVETLISSKPPNQQEQEIDSMILWLESAVGTDHKIKRGKLLDLATAAESLANDQ